MKFTSAIIAATLLCASAVASANTPIQLQLTDTNEYSGTFAGKDTVNTFDLDLTSFTGISGLYGQVSANFTGGVGYDVTNVTFDGIAFHPDSNTHSNNGKNGNDLWTMDLGSLSTSSALHHIVVTGIPKAPTQGFVGSVTFNVTPVPEPETYAMLFAGLGLLGVVARRRKA